MPRLPMVVELPHDELGGASGAALFHVMALGKRNTPEYPYTVVNEKISADLGRALGLRVPEVQLYRFRDEWYAFMHYLDALFDKPYHFLSAVQSPELVAEWCDRIAELPNYLVNFVIETSPPELLTAEERTALTEFLNERKFRLRSLIAGRKDLFPSLEGA